MPSPAAPSPVQSSPSVPPDPEAALSSALWHACRAEAEAMWNEIHSRLRADESRKAAFIDHLTRDLMNKTTRKRRSQLIRRLSENPSPSGQQAA